MTHSNSMRRFAPAIAAFLAAAAVAGCSQPGSNRPARGAIVQPVKSSEQLNDAVASLSNGNVKHARKVLKAIIKRDRANARATMLLASLDENPLKSLGQSSFAYKVQPGETMVELAQRYLGNSLKFYSLSRYNGLAVPSSLRAGQMLRIPGVAPKPITPPPSRFSRPEPPKASAPSAPVDRKRVNQLRASGLGALNRGQINRSVLILRQAAAIDPGNPVVRADLDRALRLQATVRGGK